jgi:hypothetical protein
VATPLGERVVLTRNRWREIVRFKHPALKGHDAAMRACLQHPTVIRASATNATVHLYYLAVDARYLCIVVGGDQPAERFVITAYFTEQLKKGDELWTE